jgi:hypothetical protein
MKHSKAHGNLHACLITVMQGMKPVRVDERNANCILMVFNYHEEFEEYLKAGLINVGKTQLKNPRMDIILLENTPK